jgi:hypothetical protein
MKRAVSFIAIAGLLSWVACSSEDPPGSQGQTHWLRGCSNDAECGELSCDCGRCVARCGAGDRCEVPDRTTTCQAASSGAVAAMCGVDDAVALCLEPCGGGCDDGQRCVAGACIATGSTGGAAGDSGESGASGGSGTSGGSATSGGGASGGGAAGRGGSSGGGASGSAGGGSGRDAGTAVDAGGGNDAALACAAVDQDCDIGGTECCAGSHCMQMACTNSIPPHCFGKCVKDSGGTLDGGKPMTGMTPCGTGGLTCNSATQICVSHHSFMTRFECMPVPPVCNANRTCDCLVNLVCEQGFRTCNEPSANEVACICIAC